HPTESGNVGALRAQLGTLAAQALQDFDFASASLGSRWEADTAVPRPLKTLNGIDVLVKQKFAPLKGLRVGLITNHTGVDRHRHPTIDLLSQAPGVELKAL